MNTLSTAVQTNEAVRPWVRDARIKAENAAANEIGLVKVKPSKLERMASLRALMDLEESRQTKQAARIAAKSARKLEIATRATTLISDGQDKDVAVVTAALACGVSLHTRELGDVQASLLEHFKSGFSKPQNTRGNSKFAPELKLSQLLKRNDEYALLSLSERSKSNPSVVTEGTTRTVRTFDDTHTVRTSKVLRCFGRGETFDSSERDARIPHTRTASAPVDSVLAPYTRQELSTRYTPRHERTWNVTVHAKGHGQRLVIEGEVITVKPGETVMCHGIAPTIQDVLAWRKTEVRTPGQTLLRPRPQYACYPLAPVTLRPMYRTVVATADLADTCYAPAPAAMVR